MCVCARVVVYHAKLCSDLVWAPRKNTVYTKSDCITNNDNKTTQNPVTKARQFTFTTANSFNAHESRLTWVSQKRTLFVCSWQHHSHCFCHSISTYSFSSTYYDPQHRLIVPLCTPQPPLSQFSWAYYFVWFPQLPK